MNIQTLKEQIFEVGGLQVDWDNETIALAQVEADAQAIVSELVESDRLSIEDGEKLVNDLMNSYV